MYLPFELDKVLEEKKNPFKIHIANYHHFRSPEDFANTSRPTGLQYHCYHRYSQSRTKGSAPEIVSASLSDPFLIVGLVKSRFVPSDFFPSCLAQQGCSR